MIAIKNWFLERNNLRGLRGMDLTIIKETEKAALVGYQTRFETITHWIPKSAIIDAWEKDISGFGYHDYLVNTYHDAYNNKEIENYTIKSGRNIYRGDNFIHQLTSKKLQERLKYYNIKFMSFKEWQNR